MEPTKNKELGSDCRRQGVTGSRWERVATIAVAELERCRESCASSVQVCVRASTADVQEPDTHVQAPINPDCCESIWLI